MQRLKYGLHLQAAERTNDDFQIDDVFISKANRKQSESQQEERDRANAIFGMSDSL